MLITVDNFLTDDLEKSYLSDAYSIGVTSIKVKNSDRFGANDRILIGEMGQERSEIVTVDAVSSDKKSLTISQTAFSHSQDDPVFVLRFDQVRFYKSVDNGSTYSILTGAGQPLDVDNADLQTKYNDLAGGAAIYKITFYHSLKDIESDYSDEIYGEGWRRNQVGSIIDEVLQEVSDPNEQNVTRAELMGFMNDVNDDLLSTNRRPYSFLRTSVPLDRTAATNFIDLPVDEYGDQIVWKFDRLDYTHGDITETIKMFNEDEFRNMYPNNVNNTTTQRDSMPDATIDTSSNRILFSHPFATSESGVFTLYFWKYFNKLDTQGDIIETPSPRIYKLYLKQAYYQKRAVTDPAFNSQVTVFKGDYGREKMSYNTIDRKDVGTPRGFRPLTRRSVYKNYRRT